MNVFEKNEILEIAIQIEKNGEQFYQHAIEITKSGDAAKLFAFLRDEESKHQNTFKTLLAKVGESKGADSYPGELTEFLRTFVDEVLFPSDPLQADYTRIQDTLSAIRYAIKKELDSIYYYRELKAMIPSQHQVVVDAIIDEERKHFLLLIKHEKTLG